MATRKISDLTLLTAVSSSDTLFLLDNSDPTDQNKRTTVGSIFSAIPGGTSTNPGIGFELKTSTGLYSTTQGQIGLSLGDAKLNLQKVGTSLVIAAQDSVDSNLDLTIQAQGTGLIRLGSPLAIVDTLFAIPNTSDNTKAINFSAAQIASGTVRTFVLPDPGQTDTIVTQTATQTLTNKTLSNASFSGTTSITNITVSGNTILGDNNSDTLTVNATSTFASAATFSNAVQINSTLGATGATTLGSTLGVTGITTLSGLLNANGGIAVDTNAFTVADTTGNTAIAGTLNVTGITTLTGVLNANGGVSGNVTGNVTGSISGVTGDFTGAVTVGTTLDVDGNVQLGASNAQLVGIGRAPSSYNLEVAGDIYFEGDTLIGGFSGGDGFVIQKREAAINFDVRDNLGGVQLRVDTVGRLGVLKSPGKSLDVSGDSNVDGDFYVSVVDALNDIGGTVYARDIVLTDPITSSTTTLSATSAGSGSGVSRAKVFFHAYS